MLARFGPDTFWAVTGLTYPMATARSDQGKTRRMVTSWERRDGKEGLDTIRRSSPGVSERVSPGWSRAGGQDAAAGQRQPGNHGRWIIPNERFLSTASGSDQGSPHRGELLGLHRR